MSTPVVAGRSTDRSLTPGDRATLSPQVSHKSVLGRSSLRNELSDGEGMGSWTKEKFVEKAAAYVSIDGLANWD